MMNDIRRKIFEIKYEEEFNEVALDIFHFQSSENPVYKKYLSLLKINSASIHTVNQIPFLPIELFKSHEVITQTLNLPEKNGAGKPQTFTSSGTSGSETSKHFITDISIYEESFRKGFELFYGPITDYCVLALLPSYLEREGSSLIYMMDQLIKASDHPKSAFYLHNHHELFDTLNQLKEEEQKTWLIGVPYALLDFTEEFSVDFPSLVVMETGGMKGRRKEMIREELHEKLIAEFGVSTIHSEYGMTELLSQSYSKGNGMFRTPPWMKVVIHPGNDPFSISEKNSTGTISFIDLANIYSCSFIVTQDLGKIHPDGSFEVLGRTDVSDIRGCNLMIE